MKGDILVIEPWHRKAAEQAAKILIPKFKAKDKKRVITVAGESGAGKSEIASALAENLEKEGFKTFIFQQDDYFIRPPKTNEAERRKDISLVGIHEVNMAVLEQNCKDFKAGKTEVIKPLVDFDADKIGSEKVNLEDYKVVIAEGTYTTKLENSDERIFIDRDYIDTGKARKKRAREAQDDFLENVLKIEHKEISSHKPRATLIVDKEYNVKEAK
ncbi:MAG: zeta toxin family protein [Candidatus Margulisbacteria bacterium]|nr:zeta toxin family protein [Candidatus Margulisiibacteriota bacterium]